MPLLRKLIFYGLLLTCVMLTNAKDKRIKSKRNRAQWLQSLYQNSRKNITSQTVPTGLGICRLDVNKSVALKFSELTRLSALNIVDLRLYAGSINKTRILPKLIWTWTSTVGREILWILSINVFQADPEVIRTLTVGKRSLEVEANESRKGYVSSEKDGLFVARALVKGLIRKLNSEHEICYTLKTAGKGLISRNYTCCRRVIGKDTNKAECYRNKSRLTKTFIFYVRIFTVLFFVVFLSLLAVHLGQSSPKCKYSEITESPLSLSSIISKLFFEGHGLIKSFVRRSILVCVMTFTWLYFPKAMYRDVTFFNAWFIYWALFYPFTDLFKTTQSNRRFKNNYRKLVKSLKWYAGSDVEDIFSSGYDNQNVVNLLTLLFNIKRWKRGLQKFYERLASRRLQCRQGILKFVEKYIFCLMTVLSCFIYVTVAFFMVFCVIFLQIIALACTSIIEHIPNRRRRPFSPLVSTFQFLHTFLLFSFMLMFGCVLLLSLPTIFLFSFVGLILNVVHYVPYITFFLIFTFYSWISWTSLEETYFSLKIQVYEVCKAKFRPDDDDVDDDDDDDDDHEKNDDNGDNEDINAQVRIMTKWKYNHNNEPMISKKLYDKIREKLLPYNFSLFYFAVKALCVFFLAYFVFTVVNILALTDISRTVKVLTAMVVSVVPYIFNVFVGKTSMEVRKAVYEAQKLKIEKLVSELTVAKDLIGQRTQKMSYYSSRTENLVFKTAV